MYVHEDVVRSGFRLLFLWDHMKEISEQVLTLKQDLHEQTMKNVTPRKRSSSEPREIRTCCSCAKREQCRIPFKNLAVVLFYTIADSYRIISDTHLNLQVSLVISAHIWSNQLLSVQQKYNKHAAKVHQIFLQQIRTYEWNSKKRLTASVYPERFCYTRCVLTLQQSGFITLYSYCSGSDRKQGIKKLTDFERSLVRNDPAELQGTWWVF